MNNPVLSDELRRFISSIESIPHLEAMLLLREDVKAIWHEAVIANRLYMSEDKATGILHDLCLANICTYIPDQGFSFSPNGELSQKITQLAAYYASHLIEVTNMIHTKSDPHKRLRQFANAFKFKKED
ncbi:MAG TPA: hypothetical protein VIZ65_13955 [Cellvibrionaceae bacterium]